MDKPKLTLAPPPPALRLDVPQSLRWRDGSELHVMPDGGILLIEEMGVYSVRSQEPLLRLVWPPSSLIAMTRGDE